ncbi:type 4b pilus protein PilO2 [Citrobacter koseri]|uniref:type 4b pilus protein PilO2 n=1 Tax=Citrobacter koseri TaxID=545 RepID=UPI001F29D4A6|nr:type 4b pilus protein PilO2 [Citrobacter koseri]
MQNIRPPVLLRAGKTDYALGLLWQTTRRKGWREALRVARDIPGADHYVQLSTRDGTQAGLAHLNGIRHRQARSLAALALSWRGEDWIGIFQTDEDRYWFIAITGGEISPLSDISGDRETVRQALESWCQFHPLPVFVVAPDDFPLPGSQQVPWTELLAVTPGRRSRLRALNPKKTVVLTVLLIALVIGGWHAFNVWQQARRDAAIAAQQAAVRARIKAQQELSPWKKTPVVPAFSQACRTFYRSLKLSVDGWGLSAAECREAGARVAYNRVSPMATVSTFSDRIMQRYHVMPEFSLSGGAKVADFTVPFATFPATAFHDDTPPGGQQAAFPLVSFLQQHALPFQFAQDTAVPGQSLSVHRYHFTVASGLAPDTWLAQLPANGVRLSSIRLTFTGGVLHYETQGILYAKN